METFDAWDVKENKRSFSSQEHAASSYDEGCVTEEIPRNKKRRRLRRTVSEKNRVDLFSVHDRRPTSESLIGVLTQAVISQDKALLDSLFLADDLLVIRRTISDIPSAYIESFLGQIVSRCYESPFRIRMLGPWLRELLRQHITFCDSMPNIRKILRHFYSYAVSCLRYHYSALKLQGELDALTYFAYRRINESRVVKKGWGSQEPLLAVRESNDNPGTLDILMSTSSTGILS